MAVNLESELTRSHELFMTEALKEAKIALANLEVPIGCVVVHDGKIIGRGRNRTNETLNATKHAELVAIDKLLKVDGISLDVLSAESTSLYVTVEPCVMCASALRQLKLTRVYFGCHNERFGGCGSVLPAHVSSPSLEYPPLQVTPGIFRAEAIMLLRQFYLNENQHAPKPKKKVNRTLNETV